MSIPLHRLLYIMLSLMAPLYYSVAQSGNWAEKTPMPTARYGMASGVINGKFYVASGAVVINYPPYTRFTVLEVYDAGSNSWSTKSPIPLGIYGATVGVINGKLYVAGGQADQNSGGNVATLQVYDPALDSWTNKSSMSFGSGATCGGVINGKLYVATGSTTDNTGLVNNLRVYDPATDAWANKAPMTNNPAAFAGGGVVNGILYIIGGQAGSTYYSTVRAYDPTTDTWTTKAPMPSACSQMAVGVVNGLLYAVGGQNSVSNLNSVVVYNPVNDTWNSVASMPTARSLSSVGIVNGQLYVVGGVGQGGSFVGTNEVFTASASVTNIIISPANPFIMAGSIQPFTATEYLSDGSVSNGLTNFVWSSSIPAVATITTNGVATGLTNGATTITASSASVSGSTILTVSTTLTNRFLYTGTTTNITLAPGTYDITAYGAQGGVGNHGGGGLGAEMEAQFYFPTSSTLIVLVGGGGSGGSGGGGGGGSFVAKGTNVLVVAGGGGGGGGGSGLITTGGGNGTGSGGTGGNCGGGGGGNNGSGGIGGCSSGGGGGFYGSGGSGNCGGGSSGGGSFLSGGVIGHDAGYGGGNGGYGGGGGGADNSFGGGGGGGGYSGGGGGGCTGGGGTYSGGGGGGGGSYVDSSAIMIGNEVSGVRNGNGEIDIVSVSSSGSTLTNIIISPASPAIVVSSNQQFTATGFYNDGSTQNLTSSLAWSSSSSSVAIVNTAGLATGLTAGSTTIKAISGSISNTASLTVLAFPVISVQPTNNTVSPNGSVTLTVSATGGNLGYQWRFNGTNISGATSPSFTITNVASTNVGVYTVVVSNLAGSVTSRAAIVGTTAITMYAGVIVNGPLGSNYLIQAGSNLGAPTNWTTLTNIALTTQPYIFIDYSTPFNSQQFYRAVPQ